ncbi:MAG: roadblock/LC7 domain-containing protein [Sumerlaeia bacterium]
MLPLSRSLVLVLLFLLGIVATAMAFAGTVPIFENVGNVVPLVLAAEIVLYFFLTLFTNPRIPLVSTIVLSVGMALFRAIACVLGSAAASAFSEGQLQPIEGWMVAWIGNPIGVLIQFILLALAAPHFLEMVFPDMIGRETRQKLLGSSSRPVESNRSAQNPMSDSNPSGGFIQVFSYDELTAVIRKSHGLEGFIIYNNEGLIVWRDLPIRLESDRLVAKLMALHDQLADVVEASSLSRVRKVMVESREHLVFITPLNQNFGMIMVYNQSTTPSESFTRLAVIAKTTREFLQWKYPGLPVTASMTQSQMAIEMVKV